MVSASIVVRFCLIINVISYLSNKKRDNLQYRLAVLD